MNITIIGILDKVPEFSERIKEIIAGTHFFAGGNRHYEWVKSSLPSQHHWVPIVAPLENLWKEMRAVAEPWVVFASGDPLFFGIGNTIKRVFPEAEVQIFPQHNAIQLLGHRLGVNYGEYPVISLTGRSWKAFDKALIEGAARLAILTDRRKTPAVIAARMMEYGYNNYRMLYGERLGGAAERICHLSLEDALSMQLDYPNCFFLEKIDDTFPARGISEMLFEGLSGRPGMITKMPVRLTTLALMELNRRSVFWDIGACTGSVSVEARLGYPHLEVTAFEIRPESEGIITRNARKFQAPGIRLLMGNYLEVDKEALKHPDAVFIGGYGGRMEEILDDVNKRLRRGGVMAFNSVSDESRNRFLRWNQKNGYSLNHHTTLRADDHNPIHILVSTKYDE